MRSRAIVLVLVALPACGWVRHARVEPPPPSLPAGPERAAAAATPAPDALGCLDHPRIDHWEHRLRTHRKLRAATERGLERGERYLPTLRAIMTASGLPPSLALLPVVESGFRPNARGRFGDAGLWQFRAPTARRMGLVVDRRRDDRLHPERSTRAAARYLRRLHARYKDWPLALAAYNAGPGRVDGARRRLPGADFWELAERGHLPRTSRDFVPRFLAVVRVSEDVRTCDTVGPRRTAAR